MGYSREFTPDIDGPHIGGGRDRLMELFLFVLLVLVSLLGGLPLLLGHLLELLLLTPPRRGVTDYSEVDIRCQSINFAARKLLVSPDSCARID